MSENVSESVFEPSAPVEFLDASFDEHTTAFPWRQPAAAVSLAALADLTIYRGHGFAGLALLFALAPLLLCMGVFRLRRKTDIVVIGVMLALLAIRLVWCGSTLLAVAGFGLLAAFAMTLSGLRPYVLETAVFASQTILAGYMGLKQQWRLAKFARLPLSRIRWLNTLLPVAAFVVFGVLFLLANPDLLSSFSSGLEAFFTTLREWLLARGPTPFEILFWLAAIWIATGAICPVMRESLQQETTPGAAEAELSPFKPAPAMLFLPYRNMLLTVIGLFAAYLVFEFKTLWFREPPPGFYYSGYAHEGAFWLTVALALATMILSLVFRGGILHDPRQASLRRLAWIWSVENILLAATVYHRLSIYVEFNGMTRMRVIGVFGISAVLAGFALVLFKIARSRDFIWLVRRQLWVLALAVYLFALTPVDAIVMRYNVARVLEGDLPPAVQISEHPIDAEGLLLLPPLLHCNDQIIKEGVRALLSRQYEIALREDASLQDQGWTAWQGSRQMLLRRLKQHHALLTDYQDPRHRDAAIAKFQRYAYQWY